MANSKIDYPVLVSVINGMADVLKTEGLTYRNLADYIAVVSGIEKGKKLGFLGEFAEIGMKSAGSCAWNKIDGTIPISEKEWFPKPFDSEITLCSDDIEETLGSPTLKNGTDRNDLRDTEVYDQFIDRFELALAKMYWRMAWMADEDAANYDDSPAGVITNTYDVKLFNTHDGLWKRLRTIIAATPAQRITIAENAQATYALQNSEYTPAKALITANALFYSAPLEIQTKMIDEGWVAYCTQAFMNKLKASFQSFELESMKTNLENGIQALSINSVPFVALPELDNMITKFENSGTKYNDPYRVVVTKPENLMVGVPSFDTWGEYKVGYDERAGEVWIHIKDKIDTNVLFDNMVMVAI